MRKGVAEAFEPGMMTKRQEAVVEGIFSTEEVTTNGSKPDAFSRWYNDLDAKLPYNLNRVQIQGIGKRMRQQTTQHFWKLGEYVSHVENIMREEAFQVLDTIGYEPEYLQRVRRWYEACNGMKRKDLSISAYKALSVKGLTDEDRNLLAMKYDDLTRDGFEKVVNEYLVVNGTKVATRIPYPRKHDDSKKNIDEVDELIAKGEALLVAMPEEEREAAIEAFLESKSKPLEPDNTPDVFQGTHITTVEAHEAGFAASLEPSPHTTYVPPPEPAPHDWPIEARLAAAITTLREVEAERDALKAEVERLRDTMASWADRQVVLPEKTIEELRKRLGKYMLTHTESDWGISEFADYTLWKEWRPR